MLLKCLSGANCILGTFTQNIFFTLTIHYKEDMVSLILKIRKLRCNMTSQGYAACKFWGQNLNLGLMPFHNSRKYSVYSIILNTSFRQSQILSYFFQCLHSLLNESRALYLVFFCFFFLITVFLAISTVLVTQLVKSACNL